MKIAFFGTKDYDKIWFGALTDNQEDGSYGIQIHFIEANLNEDTAVLPQSLLIRKRSHVFSDLKSCLQLLRSSSVRLLTVQ